MPSDQSARIGVIVSHTSKQGNVYERPVAALAARRPVLFLTGLYAGKLPWWLRIAARLNRRAHAFVVKARDKRIHPLLSGENVISTSGAICEGIRLGLRQVRFSDKFHDILTATWILTSRRVSNFGIFHGFQDSCYWSLRASRFRGLKTALEVILPPLREVDCPDDRRYNTTILNGRRRAGQDRQSLRRQADMADRIIIQSPYSAGVLQALGVDKGKCSLVDLGVDTTHFSPPRQPPTWEGTLRLLFVGQIGFRKGIDLLVDALAEIPELPICVTLTGHVVDEIGEKCVSSCKRASYLGVVSDSILLEEYQKAHWLVIPSRSEGGCNVVMEALSCGLPCLVTEGAQSVISQGCDGLIVPNNNVSALAQAIRQVYQLMPNDGEWRANARAKALQHDWQCFHSHLNAVYTSLQPHGGGGKLFCKALETS